MNHSKYGLNAPFYKWLDEVRRAIRREKELLQKLEYYNVKFMGYQGITYDRIGSNYNNNSKGDQNMLYWLDKMDELEKKLAISYEVVDSYYRLMENLEGFEVPIIRLLCEGKATKSMIAFHLGISLEKYDKSLNRAVRKWELEINKPVTFEKQRLRRPF